MSWLKLILRFSSFLEDGAALDLVAVLARLELLVVALVLGRHQEVAHPRGKKRKGLKMRKFTFLYDPVANTFLFFGDIAQPFSLNRSLFFISNVSLGESTARQQLGEHI